MKPLRAWLVPPTTIATGVIGVIVVALDIATLGLLLYCTVRLGKTFEIGYASAAWSIVFFGSQIPLLLTTVRSRNHPDTPAEERRRRRRSRALAAWPWVVVVDFATAIFLAVSGVMIALADLGSDAESPAGSYHYVADPWRLDAAILQMAVGWVTIFPLSFSYGRETS